MEEQLEKLTAESKEVQAALDTVNAILLDKGFRRGDIKEALEAPVPKEVVLPKQESEPPKVVVQYTLTLQSLLFRICLNKKALYH